MVYQRPNCEQKGHLQSFASAANSKMSRSISPKQFVVQSLRSSACCTRHFTK